jgi:hypothetical protein
VSDPEIILVQPWQRWQRDIQSVVCHHVAALRARTAALSGPDDFLRQAMPDGWLRLPDSVAASAVDANAKYMA